VHERLGYESPTVIRVMAQYGVSPKSLLLSHKLPRPDTSNAASDLQFLCSVAPTEAAKGVSATLRRSLRPKHSRSSSLRVSVFTTEGGFGDSWRAFGGADESVFAFCIWAPDLIWERSCHGDVREAYVRNLSESGMDKVMQVFGQAIARVRWRRIVGGYGRFRTRRCRWWSEPSIGIR
jgi:hypothetical protein